MANSIRDSNRNARFDSRFDSNANGRFAGPTWHQTSAADSSYRSPYAYFAANLYI